ncbi:MAG: glycosyltransferase family 4 protein [Thermoplasmata archaeon]|jgi:glycosyltransferase involved in cell wall biosynthesis
MESLKINFLLYSMERTGGVRVILNFARRLHERGHGVTLVTGRRSAWFSLPKDLSIRARPGLTYLAHLAIQRKWKYSIPREIGYLERLGAKLPPADVNVATFSTTVYPVTLRSAQVTPFHHMQHMETLFAKSPTELGFIRASYFVPAYRVANSRWLADRYYDLTQQRVPVLNAAVEHEVFHPQKGETKPHNEFRIVALAKGGWKNIDTVIQVVKKLRAEYAPRIDIRLKLFGGSRAYVPLRESWVEYCRGYSDDQLAALYSSSDVEITASFAESFPLPPLEAMACGCPVITTPYGTEDYARDSDNCLIVPPNDPSALSSALHRLLDDGSLGERLSSNGLATAARFNYDDQTKLYEASLREAIAQHSQEQNNLKSVFDRYLIPV